ncbi:MAG: PAS domain-containing sensor histidine kinase, partial [Anaerolineae bacterium]|nr:PAS domain-containing sensor histidine kinase [Anaerolineae bacterium]
AANIIGAAIQRKESEIELRHSEARTRAILDALPDLVFRIDQSGNILDFSVNEKHPLYLPRETVVGSHSSKIWPQVITDLMMEKVNLVIERKSATPIEFVFSSSERTYEVRLDGLGKHEVLGIVRDITDRARLEQMKSDFINRASHELRTPLTTSILMTDLIKEGGTEDEVEEYWQILTNELQRQKNLIDRFLVAGRLENNMLAIEAVPLALVPIIDESIAAVNPLAKKKNIEIAKDLPDKLPKILGDESSLQQVFINLINNAIKFSPEGSQVTVQVKDNANSVSTKITDQGIGIPENDQAHLFERFFRARNVNIAEIPGSGVGLYIVKSIIEELGGEILVSSVIGEGTTLEVKLLHSLSETTGVNPKHSIINSIETPH